VGSPAATTGPAQAGPTHKRSGSAYSRTPTYSLKSNDSSSSSASLGSPSTSTDNPTLFIIIISIIISIIMTDD
jgi:hypothetical protein